MSFHTLDTPGKSRSVLLFSIQILYFVYSSFFLNSSSHSFFIISRKSLLKPAFNIDFCCRFTSVGPVNYKGTLSNNMVE